ncbi:MAG: hypothetical protein CM15mP106_2500 [Candidatus Neomarinimicrobiota bacterium]|nr:MAG: hypothetical protein CM15mP106_2500 [Candidatus Neomarinimicrobiota bacterium]
MDIWVIFQYGPQAYRFDIVLIQYQWFFNPVKNKKKRVVKDFDTTRILVL